MLRDDLERLMTLSRDQIEWACSDTTALAELVEFGFDEVVELRENAELEWLRGHPECAQHLEQEASAWNATVRVLRTALAQSRSAAGTGRHRRTA